MKKNKLIVGVGASLLATKLLSVGGEFTPGETSQISGSGIHQKIPSQSNEETNLGKSCLLLLQNFDILETIAAKTGIAISNNSVPAGKNMLELNHDLILQTRLILITIGKNLGVLIPSLPQADGSDLLTQNHLLLLGNGLILWAIALSQGIKICPREALRGSMFEQNYQMLLAHQKIINAIADKL